MSLQRASLTIGVPALFGAEHAIALLRAAWPAAVGAELARRTEVVALEGRTLRVRVPDGRWRSVLHRMSGEIIRRLRETAGPLAPTRLGFMEARLEALLAGAEPETEVPPPPAAEEACVATDVPPVAVPVAVPLPAIVEEAARSIPDEELRARFLESARLYFSRQAKT